GTRELSQRGPFTPDHILHTKAIPLWLQLPKSKSPEDIERSVREQVADYRQRYRDYFMRYKTPGVTMLDPNPRVILIPGLGMFTTGNDPRACRITRGPDGHTTGVCAALLASGV